ncbi:xanthine dehydrogenase family protein subunit M [Sphingomonas koreensis]|nr:xanthine dehydrogenase family protein subunit M [Sphingomonas koreensis]
MYPFTYHRPTTIDEARALFEASEDGSFLSGGHTLLPTLKARLAAPSDMIDLTAIDALKGVEPIDGGVRIGGATTHAEVARHPLVRERLPVLAGLAGSIGDRHVRHRGTIGGSVANNDPAADYPAAVLGFGATVVTDRRRLAADDYFIGLYETVREPDEIVVAIDFPAPLSAGYAKFRNLASRYAVAATFVVRTEAGVRVAVTGAYSAGVSRPRDFEAALDADFRPEALDPLTIDPQLMLADPAATAAYRANLVKVLARRAVAGQGDVLILK